ncbi:hypothetical protein BV394_02115 [Brevirhabdus pacifica]|uniref:Uncharacterized protein n=2 Tax=Brevirhabdus pacifica TaxID=1267768 RepID=A0A1U7DFF2_9RHOB|nr:hypothetical protein [Brevirhabdus pacifica]APX88675.1 hypothetical protein BV394_02115 [Brevirhabdus pacifica]OWU79940.1 hypothetical protein ATO5_02795 [Loktanella sp. 22II-4b]PJJ86821.1 hypothetical protein CLV77_1379 [Brevirhabdus pacifica]
MDEIADLREKVAALESEVRLLRSGLVHLQGMTIEAMTAIVFDDEPERRKKALKDFTTTYGELKTILHYDREIGKNE